MGTVIKKIIAIFFISVLQGNIIFGTFYSPYNFNRHLSHFQAKNYQFWHELYRNNFEQRPFLRYSQPGYISSGPLHKIHTLDTVDLAPSPVINHNNNNDENLNVNNDLNQWNGLNNVYGFGYRYPVNPGLSDENLPSSTIVPSTKRTTRPRTTYTTKERTTVALSTEAITRPTGSGENEVTNTTPKPSSKPSKSPSELLAQIAQINNSSQGILGQLGKPTRKPGSTNLSSGSRPSASSLLQQIQKVNSSAQNLLVTLKPNTKYLASEIKDEIVWTTARTTTEQENTNIPVVISDLSAKVEEIHPIETPVILLNAEDRKDSVDLKKENIETTTNKPKLEEISTTNESSEKMILVSTSKATETNIESRHSDIDLSEPIVTTQMPLTDGEENTTFMDNDEVNNRHEEFNLDYFETTEIEPTTVKSEEKEIPTVKTPTITTIITPIENEIESVTSEADNYNENIFETTTDLVDTTTYDPNEESNIDQELIEFILIDILTTASALQNVFNSILNPIGLNLSSELSFLEALVTSTREKGKTYPEEAYKINDQIIQITSNIGLKRLRTTKILDLTTRLVKLGKLLKSMSNSEKKINFE